MYVYMYKYTIHWSKKLYQELLLNIFYYNSGFEPGFPIVNPNTPNESLDTVVGLRYIVD